MEGACFGENEGCCGPGSMHHGPGPMGHGQVSMVHGQVSEARKLKGACSGRGLIWKGLVLGEGFGRGLYEKVEKMNFENWNKDDGRGFWKGTLTKIKM